jgi:hypothetical protein
LAHEVRNGLQLLAQGEHVRREAPLENVELIQAFKVRLLGRFREKMIGRDESLVPTEHNSSEVHAHNTSLPRLTAARGRRVNRRSFAPRQVIAIAAGGR